MPEIVVHATMAAAPAVALASSMLPVWTGPVLVVMLGLVTLAAYVRRLLFTRVEEAVLVREPRSRRHLPPPEWYRLRSSDLLRFSRYGGRW